MKNKKPFILTFGSTGWDRIFYKNDDGSEELIYEEEGRKNSHQALAAKRAGADSMLISFVGDDEIGSKCLKSLTDCGIDTRFVETIAGESTEINHQYIDKITRDYTLKRGPANLSQNYSPDMVEKYKDYILQADFVILVSKQPKDFLTAVIDFCDSNGIKTVLTISHKKFDLNDDRDRETLKKCTFIAGNFEEAKDLTGKENVNEMLDILPNLIMTKGGEGVYFINENGNKTHEDAVKAKNIVETNGAGDTFIGNMIVFVAENKITLTECVKKAMCASTLEIGKMGVLNAIPERSETESLYEEYFRKI